MNEDCDELYMKCLDCCELPKHYCYKYMDLEVLLGYNFDFLLFYFEVIRPDKNVRSHNVLIGKWACSDTTWSCLQWSTFPPFVFHLDLCKEYLHLSQSKLIMVLVVSVQAPVTMCRLALYISDENRTSKGNWVLICCTSSRESGRSQVMIYLWRITWHWGQFLPMC